MLPFITVVDTALAALRVTLHPFRTLNTRTCSSRTAVGWHPSDGTEGIGDDGNGSTNGTSPPFDGSTDPFGYCRNRDTTGTVTRPGKRRPYDEDGDIWMFRLFWTSWVNAIEQRKYQTIHTWIGPTTPVVHSTVPAKGMTRVSSAYWASLPR